MEAARHGPPIPVVPSTDTVKVIDKDGFIRDTLDRGTLRLVQTPQAFRREIILEAYRNAYRERFYGTDDASLVERLGVPVKTVPGFYDNIKITTPDDLALGELLLKRLDQVYESRLRIRQPQAGDREKIDPRGSGNLE